jgi:hypothetical protein
VNDFDLVTLTPVDPGGPPLRFHLVGDDKLTGGGGRWELVERPRRRSATDWVGTDPFRLVLPLMSDGFEDTGPWAENSVEGDIEWLLSWAQPTAETGIPPVFLVDGPLKVPAYNPRWVIESIELADDAIRRADRARIRQAFTVTLLEHTAAQVMLGPAAAVRADHDLSLDSDGAAAALGAITNLVSGLSGLFGRSSGGPRRIVPGRLGIE